MCAGVVRCAIVRARVRRVCLVGLGEGPGSRFSSNICLYGLL